MKIFLYVAAFFSLTISNFTHASNFSELANLVNEDKLEIYWVVGLPRSSGNALHLLLTQADEITAQLDEPFHVMNMKETKYVLFSALNEKDNEAVLKQAFENACEHILVKYNALAQKNNKVSLVIHDISQTLSVKDFNKFKKLTKYIIFTTRNPLQQALSMLTRYTNDQWSNTMGSTLKTADILKFMADGIVLKNYINTSSHKFSADLLNQTEEELQLLRSKTLTFVREEINACWEQLHSFILIARESSSPHCIFDAKNLYDIGHENFIKALSTQIGLKYKDAMINSWTKCTGKDFDCVITRAMGDAASSNAWNGPAQMSTCLEKKEDNSNQDLEISQFPQVLQDILLKGVRIYEEVAP